MCSNASAYSRAAVIPAGDAGPAPMLLKIKMTIPMMIKGSRIFPKPPDGEVLGVELDDAGVAGLRVKNPPAPPAGPEPVFPKPLPRFSTFPLPLPTLFFLLTGRLLRAIVLAS